MVRAGLMAMALLRAGTDTEREEIVVTMNVDMLPLETTAEESRTMSILVNLPEDNFCGANLQGYEGA